MPDVKPILDGYTAIMPYLIVESAAEFIDFLTSAFGAVERVRMPMLQGSIGHAEVEVNGAVLMLSDALPPEYPPTSSLIHFYVADCDAVYAQAMAADAISIAEPADQFYGDYLARITDPNNNQWSISTHIEDLTPDQIAHRLATLGDA